jgi:BirA family biotin operon repressor/biotin-[acetyl-CoA-carboxylase] ligase
MYLSLLLRPNCPPQELMHLTCAAAVCACDAVEEVTGFRPGIKWINDLVAGTKKLGGILTELSIHPQTHLVDWAIIGIGINCTQQEAHFPPDLRSIACSLSMATGTPADPCQLAASLIRYFSQTNLLSDKASLMARYTKDCITLGRKITVMQGQTQYHATALSVDEDGGLIICRDDGTTHTVSAGEVQVRGLFGYV